jgi:hypothetical protein
LAYSSKNFYPKKAQLIEPGFFHLHQKKKKEMARNKKFYGRLKVHVKPIGKRVKLTIYLPQGASSNLFSEIKFFREEETGTETGRAATCGR